VTRNLENEEAKARYWAVRIRPQWVVTAGKQTTTTTYLNGKCDRVQNDSNKLKFRSG